MRRFTTIALSSVSFAAIAVAATPAYAQDAPAPQVTESAQCAAIQDEAQKQACLDQADSSDPISQEGEAATLPPTATPAQETQGDIVVTGSRIRRNEFTSPDPIQIINPELGLQEGKNETVEMINSTPIAAGSVQITSAISTNFVTGGGEGAQTVSLRGLGAERTLVLLNGRRAGPAGVQGSIASFDLNTVPSSIVRSIEILKTGASSIYGSDAIAGVVNILTKKDTDGLELRGFVSPTFDGGGEAYNASATYGKDFGRGHFLISADYYRRNDLKRRDRDFLDCSEEFLKFEDGTRADVRDPFGNFSCAGVLHNSILTNNDFTFIFGEPGLIAPNGQPLFVSRFEGAAELDDICIPLNSIPGITAPADFFGCNFDGPSTGALDQYSNLERSSDVISGLKRHTLYADGAFELTPGIELYTELLYSNRKTHTDSVAQVSVFQFTGDSLLPSLTINPATGGLSLNPAFPGAFCTVSDFNCVVGDAGDPFNDEFGGNFLLRPLVLTRADSGTDIDYYRGVFGARGELPNALVSGLHWDIHGQYSRSDGDYFQDITLADAIFTQDFRTRSCVGLVTPVTGTPCIDIDFTDPRVLSGNFTPEERAFLFARDHGNTVYKQLSGEGVLSGDLLSLPAGPLGMAVGVQIRRDEIKDTPGEHSLAANAFNRASAGITAGHTLSREIFGELQIPLIHDTPFIQRLTLSAAGRLTRVKAERHDGVEDKFGDETWKLGGDWKVNDWLRFRSSIGTSFRAPALFELFLEDQTGFQAQQDVDVCIQTAVRLANGTITQQIFDNCAAAGIPSNFIGATGGVTILSGGNIGELEPETSKAKTASIILTPRFAFLPDTQVSLAVDYFDITVSDEISRLGGANIILGCFASSDFANEPLCNLITRLPAGVPDAFNITQVIDNFINVSEQQNRGIDVTGRIVHDFGNMGKLSLLAQMTWQLEDKLDLFGNAGSIIELNGEAGDPKWVGDFNASWEKGPWTVIYGLDAIGGTSNFDDLIDDQGTECRTSIFRPGAPAGQPRVPFCPDVRLAPTFYHSASITRQISNAFQMTVGLANIFDTKPPRASTVFNGGISTLGQVPVFGSQYDYLGRRLFVNVQAKLGGNR